MDAPGRRSHLIPRTRDGRIATTAFLSVLLLAMPPLTHTLWNRIDPWIGGLPFLYAVLLAVYVALTAVLIWALKRGV
jgi:hypothetical protein